MAATRFTSNGDYWKLNRTLIQNKQFKNEAQKIIEKYWRQANSLNSFGECWELLKYDIRKMAITFGKKIAKASREREHQIITSIIRLSEKLSLSGEELNELSASQLELDRMYEEKARGAFVRS